MKNVIVIMADQLKASALSNYGNKTIINKNIEKMSSEGVTYNNCYTPHPLCCPARIALWTSQYPHANGYRTNEKLIDKDINHGFKIWKENGYSTALIGKNHCFGRSDYDQYFDTWCEISHTYKAPVFSNKGMEWCEDRQRVWDALKSYDEEEFTSIHATGALAKYEERLHSTNLIEQQTIKYLDNIGENPFALWVSFPYPHEPYIALEKYLEQVGDIKIEDYPEEKLDNLPFRNRMLYKMLNSNKKREKLREAVRAYYANCINIDDAIGNIIHKLKETGKYEKTIIVLCSDHGDFAGEFNMMVKGGVFYDCLTKVPLIISGAVGEKKGIIDDTMVSLIDVLPTILRLQNLDTPRTMRGIGLPVLTEDKPREAVLSEYGAGARLMEEEDYLKLDEPFDYGTLYETLLWREGEGRRKMIRTKEWKYIYDPMGDAEELYNLLSDPKEYDNLAQKDEYKYIIYELKSKLLDLMLYNEDCYDSEVREYKINFHRGKV